MSQADMSAVSPCQTQSKHQTLILVTEWNQSPFQCWVNADFYDNRGQTFLTWRRGSIFLGIHGNALSAISQSSNVWSYALRSSLFMVKMFIFNDHSYMFFKSLKYVKLLTYAQRIMCITFIIKLLHSNQFMKIYLI